MAGIHMPIRPGNRGGRDQFKWEDVKEDKDRESYLGHSVHAPVGRWQRGKDLSWYTKSKKESRDLSGIQNEIQRVKQREKEMMLEALGMKPKTSRTRGAPLEQAEIKSVLRRGQTELDEVEKANTVQGVGFSSVSSTSGSQAGGQVGDGLVLSSRISGQGQPDFTLVPSIHGENAKDVICHQDQSIPQQKYKRAIENETRTKHDKGSERTARHKDRNREDNDRDQGDKHKSRSHSHKSRSHSHKTRSHSHKSRSPSQKNHSSSHKRKHRSDAVDDERAHRKRERC